MTEEPKHLKPEPTDIVDEDGLLDLPLPKNDPVPKEYQETEEPKE